jgi:hypothetical protein
MATWCVLTGRRLKPGAYDDWREAWWSDEVPSGATIHILRKIGDPDEVIAFGMIEGSREDFEAMRPETDAERARIAAMAPHVESTFADGAYEVVETIRT